MALQMDVQVPPELLEPMKIPNLLLMGPGPNTVSPRVEQASIKPTQTAVHPIMLKAMAEVREGIKYLFQTKNRYTMAVCGSGHCAMEAAIFNLLERGERILIAVHSLWGERVKEMARRQEIDVHELVKNDLDVFTLEEIERELARVRPQLLYVCHSESTLGLVQPMEGIGALCHRYGCLLLVDSVASAGGVPLFMDRWEIDCLYSGSQKVLCCPTGLSPISFSDRAIAKIRARQTPVVSFYNDALLLGNYWGCDDDRPRYFYTVSTSLVYALRESLSAIAEETLEKTWKRHQDCSDMLQEGLQNLGFQLFVPNKTYRLPTLTAIVVPKGVDYQDLIKFLEDRCAVVITGGLGGTAGKIWRIGTMGYTCTPENVQLVLRGIQDYLKTVRLSSEL